jgi:hypothetical protein
VNLALFLTAFSQRTRASAEPQVLRGTALELVDQDAGDDGSGLLLANDATAREFTCWPRPVGAA